MSKELLFEIGTEEIPAGFLSKAVVDMAEIIHKSLTEKHIAFKGIRCLATPRRLVLYIADVEQKQADQTIEKIGPAKKTAFNEDGHPTKAALGFAKGQGMEVSQLETIVTEKGEYLALVDGQVDAVDRLDLGCVVLYQRFGEDRDHFLLLCVVYGV